MTRSGPLSPFTANPATLLRTAKGGSKTDRQSAQFPSGARRLQRAHRELALEQAIAKLDKFHLLILDDFAYVTKDQAETSVLFELITARYEQRSLLLTANQPFGKWDTIFPDHAMTLAAVDRLVHRAAIFELNVDSYRRRTAIEHKRQRRPAAQPVAATGRPAAAQEH